MALHTTHLSAIDPDMLKKSGFSIILLAVSAFSSLAGAAEPLAGQQLLNQEKVSVIFPTAKKTVLIFMSAQCPCSGSHEPLVKDLATRFKNFQFFIVHSNANETLKETQEHFKQAALGITVIQDNKTQWADRFGALKTPHSFVLNEAGEVIYQGGVTDSHVGPQAKNKYLEEVLQDLTDGKKPRRSEGRALGCYIQRENS